MKTACVARDRSMMSGQACVLTLSAILPLLALASSRAEDPAADAPSVIASPDAPGASDSKTDDTNVVRQRTTQLNILEFMIEKESAQHQLIARTFGLWHRIKQAEKEHDLPRALQLTEQLLEVTPSDDLKGRIAVVDKLASLSEQCDDIDASTKYHAQIATLTEQQYGKDHWRTETARIRLSHAERVSKLDSQNRPKLLKVRTALRGIEERYFKDFDERVLHLRNAVRELVELLGDQNIEYLDALDANASDLGNDYQKHKSRLRSQLYSDRHPEQARLIINGIRLDSDDQNVTRRRLTEAAAILGHWGAETDSVLAEMLQDEFQRAHHELRERESFPESLSLLKSYVTMLENIYDDEHWRLLEARYWLRVTESLASGNAATLTAWRNAQTLEQDAHKLSSEEVDRALANLEAAAKIYADVEPSFIASAAHCRHVAASLLQRRGQGQDATTAMEFAMDACTDYATEFGKTHPNTIQAAEIGTSYWREAANYHANEGNWDEASQAALYMLSLDLWLRGLGDWRVVDGYRLIDALHRRGRLSDTELELLNSAQQLHKTVPMQDYTFNRESMAHNRAHIATLSNVAEIYRRLLGADSRHFTEASLDLARLYYATGESDRAEPLLTEILKTRRSALGPRHPETKEVVDELYQLHATDGNEALATHWQDESCWLEHELRDPFAIEYVRVSQTLTLVSNLDLDPDAEISHLSKIARQFARSGEWDQWDHLAGAIVRQCRERFGVNDARLARALIDQSAVKVQAGDLGWAQVCLHEARDILDKSNSAANDRALVLHGLGVIAERLNEDERALRLLEECLKAFQSSAETDADRATMPQVRANIAFVLRKLSRDQEAEAIYLEVLHAMQPGAERVQILDNLGFLYLSRKDYVLADRHLQDAWNWRNENLPPHHPDRTDSLHDLALLMLAQGKVDTAWEYAQQALAIARHGLDLALVAHSERQQLAMVQKLRHRLDLYTSIALQNNAPAESIYQEIASWKGLVLIRRQIVDSALARQEDEFIRLRAEKNKIAAQLTEMTLNPAFIDTEDQWKNSVNSLLEAHEASCAALNERAATLLPTATATWDSFSVAALKKALQPDSALVDYSIYLPADSQFHGANSTNEQRRVLAFVVRPDAPVAMHDLGLLAPIATAIENWRSRYGLPTAELAENPARVLRDLLWEAVEPNLSGIDTVLIAPDGLLARLPFMALPGKQEGTYLLEERSLVMVPAPRLCVGMAIRARPDSLEPQSHPDAEGTSPTLLLVGDVDYGEVAIASEEDENAARSLLGLRQWKKLENTRGEILSIRDTFEQAFPTDGLKILRAGRAGKSAVAAAIPHHRWVHLATHGVFADGLAESIADSPHEWSLRLPRNAVLGLHPEMTAALVFAHANQAAKHQRALAQQSREGLLTAFELSSLDLTKVDLITLSACETGLGREAASEGLLSLQRAAHLAGARSVVASLWKVDDRVTRDLMERFYENLWTQGMTKAQALRQAQLTMLREGVDRGLRPLEGQPADAAQRLPPYYWAAFVLSGDWR